MQGHVRGDRRGPKDADVRNIGGAAGVFVRPESISHEEPALTMAAMCKGDRRREVPAAGVQREVMRL